MKDLPLVSVIVTTKNEERNIANCLKSIRNQTYKNIEIIVVDNNSDDRTKEIAEKYTAQVFNHGPERSAQRNLGAERAGGKYILYLDADMILSPEVIEECVEKMKRDNNLFALYIPERIVGEGFWIKVRDFERSFYTKTPIDAVRFIRKDIFEKVGGFDERMYACEDWDFDKRVRNGSSETKVELLKKAWVIAVPGVREGWGQVVTQANALATPAVDYNIPGLRDSINHGYNGLLVEGGDIQAFAFTCIS